MRDFHLPGRSSVFTTNGMCATSHPLAAQVAVSVLKSGGNAVDAAIAAGVLLGICEPQMTGIGGDCFVLLDAPGQKDIIALNGSGRAPGGFSAEALRDRGLAQIPERSVHAVTIPGAVDAFCTLSNDWGRLSLAETLAPAIHYAETGVPVAPRVAMDWKIADRDARLSGVARDFYLQNGSAPQAGDVFRAPMQAKALRAIAQHGRAGFYEGEVARDMVASLTALGGTHNMKDFAKTHAFYTDPISGTYKDVDLVEHPPNGQGATAILLANILSHFDLATLDPFGADRAHIEAEATKLAYDARNRIIADPDETTRLDHMLSHSTAEKLAALIDPRKAMPSATRLCEAVHRDTVYLTVVDKDRMSVSLIYSIFHSFGSGFASEKFGILFQNRGAGFNLKEGHPNEAGGNKRPMHTIIPGMLREGGAVTMPFGVMGGAYQPNGHVRFLSNMVDFGMDAQTAIDAPRSFADQGVLKLERGYGPDVRKQLADMGHEIALSDTPIGGAQAIRIDHTRGILIGASDPRKDGCAIGY
ncbi:gamma-glutamyltransferase 2. Threonine peptidase. MEROPS family T03 [Aliiroseovarius sediminilitoris]|uniref:Gamma-glutamyltransferase 2. Threonine peptidase. MEROPS family T03 n=1 Tax=Aliiroseovarius sediminilitoris TaxID=1173584 RepID=A0A1I0MP87_9RHOB|nr:gamma-glutamyltransferase family protein [Aliiroseovarius sediminilitoris]SEV89836.1 gamma-glutamyltransferase 2. Threonine peptidase. MEROPS family T03 [Aliiroseovarius sediminilitoris]